jgi:hypothetical protein
MHDFKRDVPRLNNSLIQVAFATVQARDERGKLAAPEALNQHRLHKARDALLDIELAYGGCAEDIRNDAPRLAQLYDAAIASLEAAAHPPAKVLPFARRRDV